MRLILSAMTGLLLTACNDVPTDPPGATLPVSQDLAIALIQTRVTFVPPNPDGGPIIFEFYANDRALLAFDETADKGQTELTWRVSGQQLCVTPLDESREECTDFTLVGRTLTLGAGSDMVGTITPL